MEFLLWSSTVFPPVDWLKTETEAQEEDWKLYVMLIQQSDEQTGGGTRLLLHPQCGSQCGPEDCEPGSCDGALQQAQGNSAYVACLTF